MGVKGLNASLGHSRSVFFLFLANRPSKSAV